MDQWELPTCSICYERLLSDLALLPNCGHIYHKECLNSWFDTARSGRRKCPLCRKPADRDTAISLNYCVSKPAESVASDSTNCESAASADHDPAEVADLKSRLAKSSRDNFELCLKVHDLENENATLERRVAEEVAERANVAEENKSLKLSHEKQKTTIAGLSNKVSDLKDKLRNLEHIAT